MDKNKSLQKLMAIVMSLAMILGMTPITAMAEDAPPLVTSGEITAFAPLDELTESQYYGVGEKQLDELDLPDSLTATIAEIAAATSGNTAAQATEIAVPVSSWQSTPAYDPDTLGTYVFTPTLDLSEGVIVATPATTGGFALADGVTPPQITVEIKEFMGITAAAIPWDGTGTEADPYLIDTAEDLAHLAKNVNSGNNYSGKYFKLTANLDLSAYGKNFNGGKGWIPIGRNTLPFRGTFDGNGKTINNLYINCDNSYSGVFGGVENATVKNLGLVNANIYGNDIGGVAGNVYSSVLQNCFVTGVVSGGRNIGSIAGIVVASTVSNCYSTATVSGNSNVGGIVGWTTDGTVEHCYSTGAVSGGYNVGGVLGYRYGGGTGVVSNCAALNVSVKCDSEVGRVAGYADVVSGNVAFSGMLNKAGNTSWSNKGADAKDGEDKTVAEIKADGTLFGKFSGGPWTTEDGRLPGLFGNTVEMPEHLKQFTITITNIGNQPGDQPVVASKQAGDVGDQIYLGYVLADTKPINTLSFTGGTGLSNVQSASIGAKAYTVNAGDATNGVISIVATFSHTDLFPQFIKFLGGNQQRPINGSPMFTQQAMVIGMGGTGAITYQSSNPSIATVDNNGTVTIADVGSATITATKAADSLYDKATASYVLTVTPAALAGTATISDMNSIGLAVEVYTDHILNGDPAKFHYQWKANGENIGTDDSVYVVEGKDAGKLITCVITNEIATGSVIATHSKVVPYDIRVTNIGDDIGDWRVTSSRDYARAGDSITLSYVLANKKPTNTLTFMGGTGLETVKSAGESTSQIYTVNAGDVSSNGKISITAIFTHTDLSPQYITFLQGNQTRPINGTPVFTQKAVSTGVASGSGATTYESSDADVATVNNNGDVTIVGTGTTTITATKAADSQFAEATASYMLTVTPAALAGSATITGTNAIGRVLTADTSLIIGGSSNFSYQWKSGSRNVGANAETYTIQGTDAGKIITCVVTRADATGSVTATLNNVVPYGIIITNIGNAPGDAAVTLSAETGRAGDGITLRYVLANAGKATNTLSFTGGTGLADVRSAGASTSQVYTVKAGDASADGVIEITAIFLHTDLQPQFIKFTSGNQIKRLSDPPFTSTATLDGDGGSGAITYSSSNENVATVDSNAQVTIAGVGTTRITAIKAADATFAQAMASYTLTVIPDDQYIVTFDLAGGYRTGGGALSQVVPKNGTATAPTTVRGGYSFYGWRGSFSNVTSDITITALWSANGGSSGGSSSKPDASPQPAVKWLDAASAKALADAAKAEKLVRTKNNGVYGVRKSAFAELAGLRFEHDTIVDGAVQLRLYIDKPENIKKDMAVSGYVTGAYVEMARDKFGKWFTNKVQAIHMNQTGSWGQAVKIAAKLDLSGMDTKNLYFYSYDKEANKYTRIKEPKYRIDTNGYLHFYTELAGDIVISEGELARK